jgi:hypothetical protein
MDEQVEMVAVPRAEWEALKAQVAELANAATAGHQHEGRRERADGVVDRRGLLRQGAMLAAGAVAGGGAAMVVGASPAAAANGANLVLGSGSNTASAATGLEVTGTSSVYGIGVTDNGLGSISTLSAGAILGHAQADSFMNAVAGYAQSYATAVLGTADQGPAIVGTSNGGNGVSGTSQTEVGVLGVTYADNLAAVWGSDQSTNGGYAVYGFSGKGIGVGGVLGEGNSSDALSGTTGGTGNAVYGEIQNASSSASALYGLTVGAGIAVYGEIDNPASDADAIGGVTNGSGAAFGGLATGVGPAVEATTWGTGTALLATISGKTNANAAVTASTNGTGAAVQGTATGASGRGAVFSGKAAQAKLVPGTTASHPTSGQTGDLYVDASARLWFCTVGGTTATWKQVQVA